MRLIRISSSGELQRRAKAISKKTNKQTNEQNTWNKLPRSACALCACVYVRWGDGGGGGGGAGGGWEGEMRTLKLPPAPPPAQSWEQDGMTTNAWTYFISTIIARPFVI